MAADSLLAQQAVWAPEGDALIVATFTPGGLWRVELNGRATRVYVGRDFNNPWVVAPQLSPDGRKIAFAQLTSQVNVWEVEVLP